MQMWISDWFSTCPQAVGAGTPHPRPSPVLTGKDLILQITMFFSGTYLALPTLVLKRGESASLGTGTDISTPLATDCFLNCPLACPGRKCVAGRIQSWVLQPFTKTFLCAILPRASATLKWGPLSCPVYQGGKQRHREVKAFAWRHTANKWQS